MNGSICSAEEILRNMPMFELFSYVPKVSPHMLDDDIVLLCEAEGVTLAFLQSGSRVGKLPKLRKQLARKAVLEYGLSLAETARRIGVTGTAVNYMLRDR